MRVLKKWKKSSPSVCFGRYMVVLTFHVVSDSNNFQVDFLGDYQRKVSNHCIVVEKLQLTDFEIKLGRENNQYDCYWTLNKIWSLLLLTEKIRKKCTGNVKLCVLNSSLELNC